MSVTGGWVLWLFVDAMPPFVGTWGLMVVEGGILLGFSRNSLLSDEVRTVTRTHATTVPRTLAPATTHQQCAQ